MKEFIEKLIGRLEDRKKYCEMCHEEFPNAKMSLTYEVQINAYKNAIEIVNQLAEEYNNGWIPLEEKLPNCGSAILILLKNKSDGITMDDGATCDISWLRTEDYFISSQGKYKYEDVTHWQPLPYQLKGE